MKNWKKTLLAWLLIVVLATTCVCFTACNSTGDEGGTEAPGVTDAAWAAATYHTDTTFGEGAKTVRLVVKYKDQSVTFTVKTDREMLGDALQDHALLEGEESTYGLYVKRVNGILADYDVDQSYWSLEQNGTALVTGVDTTPAVDGATYEFVYTK